MLQVTRRDSTPNIRDPDRLRDLEINREFIDNDFSNLNLIAKIEKLRKTVNLELDDIKNKLISRVGKGKTKKKKKQKKSKSKKR
tara:strand:+ start:133 stop:384 length:252 start_codon:yes stop_codon:yes gene_type:complete